MTLNAAAVESYTRGRLRSDDTETQRQLDAALAAARRYCGWHVTPVLSAQSVTLDGSGTNLLVLPTLNVTALTQVIEDGITLNVADLSWSPRGLIVKKSGYWWSSMFAGITVTFSHGYATAPDFESALLSSIDRGAFSPDRIARSIGPFQYTEPTNTDAELFTDAERSILDLYAVGKTP
jgi:hypothetical protein